MPIISVIVPVYDVERYVGKAIESLQAQTFRNYELFLVDDGSPDNSGAICDEYAAKDARITVIHKENGGAPSARNMAMNLARGEFLYFMDSDDWAEPTMLADLLACAQEHHLDLVIAGFYIDTYFSDTEFITQKISHEGIVYASAREFHEQAYELFDRNLLYPPWNKLFRRSYIEDHGLRFPQTFWDDFPFNMSVIENVERVGVVPGCYYHFIRAREASETARYRSDMYDKREEEHEWMLALYDHWDVHDEASTEMIQRRYIERLVGCIENITNKSCKLSRSEKISEIKRIISTPHAQEACRIARPSSRAMKLLLVPVRLRNATLAYLECCYVSYVKTRDVKRFAQLKANR